MPLLLSTHTPMMILAICGSAPMMQNLEVLQQPQSSLYVIFFCARQFLMGVFSSLKVSSGKT